MCIRDRTAEALSRLDASAELLSALTQGADLIARGELPLITCLLYTSDAADERSSVDLGGRRIIKKKTHHSTSTRSQPTR